MKWMLILLVVGGCARSTAAGMGGGGGVGGGETGSGSDSGSGSGLDLAVGGNVAADLGGLGLAQDLAGVADMATGAGARDMVMVADMVQTSSDAVVHVLIDNFCNSATNPTVINAPLHVALNLTFVNDSHDYDADVWSSRGYGFLDMAQGMTWKDPIQHCVGPNPFTEYFDVGIQGGPVGGACPNYRLLIHCN